MVAESLGDGTELSCAHPVHFVIPAGEIQPGNILVHLLIEDVGQLHRQVVGFPEFGIEFKNDVGSPLLRLCPSGGMFGKYIFRAGQQLLAGVSVGITERHICDSLLTAFVNLRVLKVARHSSQRYTQFVYGIVIELVYVKAVVCECGFGK